MTLSDTPRSEPTFPPPPWYEALKTFIGDLARPFVLIALGLACAWGLLAAHVTADKLGLALTALGVMYGAKAMEKHSEAKQAARVEIAKAASDRSNAVIGLVVWLAFSVLVMVDGLQTYVGVKERGKAEGWGPMAALIKRVGLVPALLLSRLILIALAAWCVVDGHRAPFVAVCAFAAFWVWVVWHNAKVLRS